MSRLLLSLHRHAPRNARFEPTNEFWTTRIGTVELRLSHITASYDRRVSVFLDEDDPEIHSSEMLERPADETDE